MTEIQAKVIISIGIPFLFSSIFFIKSLFLKKMKIWTFFSYFVVSYIIFKQQIFTVLFEMINCEKLQLDDYYSESHLKNYLGIKCYTETHYFWIYFVIVPFICFYGIILPIFVQIFVHSKRHSFKNRIKVIKYNFLMKQYFKLKSSSLWYHFF